jgi:hypothetical protein
MKRPPSGALHLTASMRVLRSHLHRPSLVVDDAYLAVKELALRLGTGEKAADDLVLEEKLKKATGSKSRSSPATPKGGPTTSRLRAPTLSGRRPPYPTLPGMR